MMDPTTAREALIVEAIGDVAKLLQQVDAVAPRLDETCQALLLAGAMWRDELKGFERRMAVITENAKTQTVKHIVARADEAARQSIEQQKWAMADAARTAFGAEVGVALQRLHAALQLSIEQRERSREPWLTHMATAAVAAAMTWLLAVYLEVR